MSAMDVAPQISGVVEKERHWDCVVVGAGPAGLAAAVYLARFLRHVLVLHNGTSRAALIPTSHNVPGYSGGITGPELLSALSRQASDYGAAIKQAEVSRIDKDGNGFILRTPSGEVGASRVILATGVVDVSPDIPALRDSVFDGQVRYCPICDGYEAIDQRIAVLGPLAHATRKAEFLRTYSDRVTVITLQEPSPEQIERLNDTSIQIECSELSDIARGKDLTVALKNGKRRAFDIIYVAMGCSIRSGLGVALGASVDEAGALEVDAYQETKVNGLYAVGDVVSCLDQIAVGTGHAAIAATAVHNSLPRNLRSR
jgi:thioredoxin reductase (NADPH)